MDIAETLRCECNDRCYPSRSSLLTHKRTKAHKAWETDQEVFDLRCRCKKLENENEALKYDIAHYRRIVMSLDVE